MRRFVLALLAFASVSAASGEDIGSVDTAFKLIGANHKIIVEVFDDPAIGGVSCYISRAKAGGFMGSIGLAEDPSDASVACRQVGTIDFKSPVPRVEKVFSEKASFLFKHTHVTRMVDPKRRVLIYLVHSDKLIDGSPKNSITAVPLASDVEIKLRGSS